MAADDAGKKDVKIDRLVRNLATSGGRAALARRLEFNVRNRNISLVSIALAMVAGGAFLFGVSFLGMHYMQISSVDQSFRVLGKINLDVGSKTFDSNAERTNGKFFIPGQMSNRREVLMHLFKGGALPDKAQLPGNSQNKSGERNPEVWISSLPNEQQDELNIIVEKKDVEKPSVFPHQDSHHLHGIIGNGPDGKPTWQPKKLTFRMTQEQKQEAHKGYCFNTRVSESLPLDRPIPDYNSGSCLKRTYDVSNLPLTSVVIVFHNEDLSALLRSVHSVLNRTPPTILQEVILIDDCSNFETHPWLDQDLKHHVKYLPKTFLHRLDERNGLMRARMAGVSLSKGELVSFLDSHIECAERWLEPMAQHIKDNPKAVSIPLIHTIDADGFDFESGFLSVLGFSWSLGQTHPYRQHSSRETMPSPVMAGGLFTVGRSWFIEVGQYDKEMRLYGGEEMEIGFKMWMCGGRLDVHPCSRVGHVFRTSHFWTGQVYKVPGEEIHRNKLRVAENWMDEYKVLAKMAIPELPKEYDLGPLDEVQSIRKRLQCKSFDWYLKNIYPELYVPSLNNSMIGAIRNEGLDGCIDTLQRKGDGQAVGAYPCHGKHGTQAFLMDENFKIRVTELSFDRCLNINPSLFSGKGEVVIGKCETAFVYEKTSNMLRQNNLCLKVSRVSTPTSPFSLTAEKCDPSDVGQKFMWPEMEGKIQSV